MPQEPLAHRDCVTNAEFTRYVTEEVAYRARVAQQLEVQYAHITSELTDIKNIVREANGKTNRNGEAIAVMQRDLQAIKTEDGAIEEIVDDIRHNGCAQLENHQQVLTTLGWSPQKKAAVAGGLVGTGVLAWPAIQRIAEVLHAAIEKWPK